MEVIQLVQQQTTMVMVMMLEIAVAVEIAAETVTTAAAAIPIRQRRLGLPKMPATKSMKMMMALVPRVPHQFQVMHHEKMKKATRAAELMATKKRMRGWFAIVAHQH